MGGDHRSRAASQGGQVTTSTFNRAVIILGVAGIMVGVLIRTGNQTAIIPLALTLGVLALAGKAMGALR